VISQLQILLSVGASSPRWRLYLLEGTSFDVFPLIGPREERAADAEGVLLVTRGKCLELRADVVLGDVRDVGAPE